MTDPISPAEAAAANAIDAENAKRANSDLAGDAETPEQKVARLTAELAAIQAAKHDPMAIPHAHHVLPSSPAPLPAKVVTPSALLAEKIAAQSAGAKPVKHRYAYQRKRK